MLIMVEVKSCRRDRINNANLDQGWHPILYGVVYLGSYVKLRSFEQVTKTEP